MVLTFLLTRLSPADPIHFMVGGVTDITAADREALREAYGLNRPLPLPFVDRAWSAVRLDLRKPFFSHRPPPQLPGERPPAAPRPPSPRPSRGRWLRRP